MLTLQISQQSFPDTFGVRTVCQPMAAVAQDNAVFCRVAAAVRFENNVVELLARINPQSAQHATAVPLVQFGVQRRQLFALKPLHQQLVFLNL